MTVVDQPIKFKTFPLTRDFMIVLLLAMSMITISSGGARKAFSIEVHTKALIGFSPKNLINRPISVDMPMTA